VINKRKSSILALCLSLVCILSACGGPAGKISQTKIETIYYDYVKDDSKKGENKENPDEEPVIDDGQDDIGPGKGKDKEPKEKLPGLIELEELIKKLPKELPIFADDGVSFVYDIVYPSVSSNDLSNAVKDLRAAIQKGLKASASTVYDKVENPNGYEILVGETNRKESIDCLNRIKSSRPNHLMDFIVKVYERKIVIIGGTEKATLKALNWFMSTFGTSANSWFYLRENYELFYAPNRSLPKITLAGTALSEYKIITPRSMEFVYGRAICDLVDYIKNDLYFSLEIDNFPSNAYKHEILIGEINRSESKSVVPQKDQYIIKMVNNKLVIKGYDSVATYYGVKAFHDMLKNAKATGKDLSLANGYIFQKTMDYSDKNLSSGVI